MIYEYTVLINEKREDGKVYLCYRKRFYSTFKKACKEAAKAIDRMTGCPAGVIIYKNIIGGYSIVTAPFKWGTPYFNKVDYYLM